MKPLTRLLTLLLTLALCLGTCACHQTADTPAAKPTAAVCGLAGPTGVGLADLMHRNETGDTALSYTVTLATSPEEIVGKLTAGEVDFAALPTNLAATLYKKTNSGIKVLALCTGCVLYVVENGDSIHTVADLKGKTVFSAGEGANPEYILRHLLSQNGLDPDTDVTLNFVAENDELASALIGGKADVALVPEPLCSTVLQKNPALRVALSVGDAWNGAVPYMGCIAVRTAVANESPAVVQAFLDDYKTSVETATADPKSVAALCEQYGIISKAAIAEKALPRCALTCITGGEMRPALDPYLSVMFAADPKSVGGALPDKEFYYEA